MVNEQGLARDSTLAFTKGVVDVDQSLPVFVYYRSSSGAIRLWRTSGGDPFFSYQVEDDYGTNPTHELYENRSRCYGHHVMRDSR
jgi:hypothetical protein